MGILKSTDGKTWKKMGICSLVDVRPAVDLALLVSTGMVTQDWVSHGRAFQLSKLTHDLLLVIVSVKLLKPSMWKSKEINTTHAQKHRKKLKNIPCFQCPWEQNPILTTGRLRNRRVNVSLKTILKPTKNYREVSHQNHNWLVVWTPLKNMNVNWDDYSQYMGK